MMAAASKGNQRSRPMQLQSNPASLSPFYSFSSHWSHVTRTYLCLTSWGTCMGGVNEQYDDLLDQEASMPMVEDNHRREYIKWKAQRSKAKDQREHKADDLKLQKSARSHKNSQNGLDVSELTDS